MARPTDYKEEYCEQVEKLCKLGAIDKEIADFFGIAESTLNLWKGKHPQFMESIKRGKMLADANVADRLFQRAMGYQHQAVKIVADAKSKEEHVVPYTEHYAPDTTACIFWLKNRQPEKWRDKQESAVEHSGNLTVEITRFGADKAAK
jgi:hypothetical protein